MKSRLPHFGRLEQLVLLVGAFGLASSVVGTVNRDVSVGEAVYVGLLAAFPLTLLSLRVLDRQRGTDTLLWRVMLYGSVMSAGGLGGLVLGILALLDQRLALGILLLVSSPGVLILGAVSLLHGVSLLVARRQSSPD